MRSLRPSREKQCCYCKLVKPAIEFHSHRYTTRTGRESVRLNSACKNCHGERVKLRKSGKPYRAQQREYRAANRVKINAANVEYRRRRPEIAFKTHLRRAYGITLEQYQQMVEAQGGACKCCYQPPALVGRKARLHVDHDHLTKTIRGLLCHQCNVILGLAQDSSAILRKLADYIEKS